MSEDKQKKSQAEIERKPLSHQHLEAMYDVGKQLYENNRYDDCNNMFRLIVMLEPHNPKYVRAFAALQQAQGKYDEAIQMYYLGVSLDPADIRNIFNIGQCLLLGGHTDEAIWAFEQLEEFRGQDIYKHLELCDEAAAIVTNLKETLKAAKEDSPESEDKETKQTK